MVRPILSAQTVRAGHQSHLKVTTLHEIASHCCSAWAAAVQLFICPIQTKMWSLPCQDQIIQAFGIRYSHRCQARPSTKHRPFLPSMPSFHHKALREVSMKSNFNLAWLQPWSDPSVFNSHPVLNHQKPPCCVPDNRTRSSSHAQGLHALPPSTSQCNTEAPPCSLCAAMPCCNHSCVQKHLCQVQQMWLIVQIGPSHHKPLTMPNHCMYILTPAPPQQATPCLSVNLSCWQHPVCVLWRHDRAPLMHLNSNSTNSSPFARPCHPRMRL